MNELQRTLVTRLEALSPIARSLKASVRGRGVQG